MKLALIVGASGQDGTLLSQLLTKRSIPYVGLSRGGLRLPSGEIAAPVDLGDAESIRELVRTHRPSHVFYLAAHHHSAQDNLDSDQAKLWKTSFQVQVLGLVHFLEALRREAPAARLFYASSSHVFGPSAPFPQTEQTPLAPDSAYAISKVAGMQACRHYRSKHGIFASTGILYNHESAYRADKFLSKKIIQTALEIRAGRADKLVLGDLSAEADWGYAPDYVEAMTRILDLPEAGDYIVATGELHTVREFVEIVFDFLGLDAAKHVREDPSFVRGRSGRLVGSYQSLERATGWRPTLSFKDMVRKLIQDIEDAGKSQRR